MTRQALQHKASSTSDNYEQCGEVKLPLTCRCRACSACCSADFTYTGTMSS